MIDHAEILAELIQILTDETEEKTPEEVLSEIVSIIDDYKSELSLEETEKQSRDNLAMMGVDPDAELANENGDDFAGSIRSYDIKPVSHINRALLQSRAKKEYFRKHGLSEEDEESFTAAEKVKHRKGITDLFNKLISEEQEKPSASSRYASGPFTKRVGLISRKGEDDEVDNDEVTPAENKWRQGRLQEIKRRIRSVKADIDELSRQNKLEKISASIINRNNQRIDELEDELEELETQKRQYED